MDKLPTINDRIKYVIEHEGHTVATFARKCGVADSTLRNLLSKDYNPGYNLIVAVINAVNQPWCDANWLVMGQNSHPAEGQDTKGYLKIIADQQRTIADLQKLNGKLTDRLLSVSDATDAGH